MASGTVGFVVRAIVGAVASCRCRLSAGTPRRCQSAVIDGELVLPRADGGWATVIGGRCFSRSAEPQLKRARLSLPVSEGPRLSAQTRPPFHFEGRALTHSPWPGSPTKYGGAV